MPEVTNLWKVKMENCTVQRSETARRLSPNPGTIRAKATRKVEAKVDTTRNVSVVDAFVTSERIAEPRLTSMEDPGNLHQKEKVLEDAGKKIQKHHKMCHWEPSIWGPSRCCQTTVTPWKMLVMLMNSQKKPQELCHRRHLPRGSRRQRLHSILKCIAESFGNLAMDTAETKSRHSSIVGIGSMSSLMLCSKWIFGHEMHRSLCQCKKVVFQ